MLDPASHTDAQGYPTPLYHELHDDAHGATFLDAVLNDRPWADTDAHHGAPARPGRHAHIAEYRRAQGGRGACSHAWHSDPAVHESLVDCPRCGPNHERPDER